MVSADSPPKKARKTLGDLLLQSAQAQLQATDTAQRMRRLEDAAPAAHPPAAYPPPLPAHAAASRETPATPAPSPDMRSDWQPDQDSDNRSDHRTDVRPDAQPDERTIEHAHARTPARSTEPTSGQPAARIDALSAAQSVAQTGALSNALSNDLSSARTDAQSTARSDIRFDARTDIRPVGHPTPVESLTPKQRDILAFLLTHRPRIINCMTIAAHVGGTEDSVRSILNRLRKNGFLTFGKTKIGAMQGLVFRYNEALCATLDELPPGDRRGDRSGDRTDARHNIWSSARTDIGSGNLTDARSFFRTSAQTDVRPHARSAVPSHDGTGARSDWRSDRPPDMHHIDEKKEREDLSVSRARSPRAMLLALTDEDIAFFWPSLARVDFRRGQIAQIVERLESLGGSLADVRKSLDHADFELGAGPLLDARGAPVADPRAYVFHAIAKTGYYRRPPGYVSAQEQAELDAAEEARRLAKARAEREEAEFQTWKMSLDPRALLALLEGRRGPEEVWLRTKWREQRRAAEG